jgi:glyoxalase family protein
MNPIEGIHHITLITGDAPGNVDFYARVLGLRLVKKTVNQDDPGVYHLFYADENGSPGADITFFEYPGAAPGRAGAGMISRIVHRVASEAALDFWQERLGSEGIASELALQGFEAVRAMVSDPVRSELLLADVLGFSELEADDWEARGEHRGGRIILEQSNERGIPGAGTVHHVAWAVLSSEIADWQRHVSAAGAHATPVIDRFYFQSVYFREPGGILYELATLDGAGFASDEAPEEMGQGLSLPPFLEQHRAQIEPRLTPLPDTRGWRPAPARAGS